MPRSKLIGKTLAGGTPVNKDTLHIGPENKPIDDFDANSLEVLELKILDYGEL